MMTQSGKGKLSRRAKRVLKEAQAKPSGFAFALFSRDADVVDDAMLAMTYERRKLLLHDLANLRDEAALEWFWRRRYELMHPELPKEMMELRDELRAVWLGHRSESQGILNKWLRWQPSKAYRDSSPYWDHAGTDIYESFTCSLDARRLVPNHLSLRSNLIQGVFEHWGHFRVCSNKDCATPYFIAKRKDQTVCDSEACKAEKQREHALKWWNENRAKKAGRKGRLKNGAPKAR